MLLFQNFGHYFLQNDLMDLAKSGEGTWEGRSDRVTSTSQKLEEVVPKIFLDGLKNNGEMLKNRPEYPQQFLAKSIQSSQRRYRPKFWERQTPNSQYKPDSSLHSESIIS